jgi:hypothetical protein
VEFSDKNSQLAMIAADQNRWFIRLKAVATPATIAPIYRGDFI